jgi:uncharacterized repeat protein (TIGR03803 family)
MTLVLVQRKIETLHLITMPFLNLTKAALLLAIVATESTQAQTLHLIHAFKGSDGASSVASLISDSNGILYGTTASGGSSNVGTAFKLDKTGTLSVLHNFTGGADGANPEAGLVLDMAANLYGTTTFGGGNGCGGSGCGTVFKIDNAGKETVLYSFTGTNDGAFPLGSLILDNSGNLYGTTSEPASIFKLDSSAKLTTLYNFTGGSDGDFPSGSLVRDAVGNLYGTCAKGGGNRNCPDCGIVYKFDTTGSLTVLHTFNGTTDGSLPLGGLIADGTGNLYGTATNGGSLRSGTVFRVREVTGSFKLLHSFNGNEEGSQPIATLVRGTFGNIYGANATGGQGCIPNSGCGTIWKLATNNRLLVLTDFGKGNQGKSPRGGLVLDRSHNLYGTTSAGGGGCRQCGTVFKITP